MWVNAGNDADSQRIASPGQTQKDPEATEVPKAIWMYVTLQFPLDVDGTASRFEVFYRLDEAYRPKEDNGKLPLLPKRATEQSSKTGWTWLGTASTCQFRVTQLEVPFSSNAVEFAVQPADVMGKLVPFQQASLATVMRP